MWEAVTFSEGLSRSGFHQRTPVASLGFAGRIPASLACDAPAEQFCVYSGSCCTWKMPYLARELEILELMGAWTGQDHMKILHM